jgi:hypothetical protein
VRSGHYAAGMADKRPPPQLSPDGRFFWDGERWAPMPASSRLPRLYRRGPRGCLDMFVVLVVVLIVVYVIAHTLLNQGCKNVGIFDWPKGCS